MEVPTHLEKSTIKNIITSTILILFGLTLSAQEVKKRQFRAAWMATVRNLDWPSKPGIANWRMKRQYRKQLDQLKDLNMNAVIVQIRPTADAFYPSDYEPWSEYLTGEQGKAPPWSFDPLEFMIEEAHNRAMEFHAWFNPYRAGGKEDMEFSPDHVIHEHPEWFVRYGKDTYFDPGMVPARKFVEVVIADVVDRYDIDAVHFDDHYYPYTLSGIDFPDSLSFKKYGQSFSPENKDEWRRENINLLVRELYDTINEIKPWVHFGISPFGVWRNKSDDPEGSDTHTRQTNYDNLYGDSRKWVRNGWLDYILPQCYQYMGRPIMDYREVTRWWGENHEKVNFYIGQGPFRLGNPDRGIPWTQGNEVVRQLYYNDSVPGLMGTSYFRSSTFMENPVGINDSLKQIFYKYPALPPISHHDRDRENTANIQIDKVKIRWRKVVIEAESDKPDETRYFVVYRSGKIGNPEQMVSISPEGKIVLKKKDLGDAGSVFITTIDRYRNESSTREVVLEE